MLPAPSDRLRHPARCLPGASCVHPRVSKSSRLAICHAAARTRQQRRGLYSPTEPPPPPRQTRRKTTQPYGQTRGRPLSLGPACLLTTANAISAEQNSLQAPAPSPSTPAYNVNSCLCLTLSLCLSHGPDCLSLCLQCVYFSVCLFLCSVVLVFLLSL